MTLEYAKKELVKRYKYLYEFAYLILAPYMYEETEEEYKERVERNLKKYGNELVNRPLIYLNINRLDNINQLFEEFLLSDKPMEETKLYQMVESKRNDKEYLDKVKQGLALVEKENKNRNIEFLKESVDIWNILNKVCDYIDEQSGDLKNKERKLYVLDQYYRILRYKNDGKIYTSGRKLNLHDCSSLSIPLYERKPSRDKSDIGITKNSFITTIANAPYYEDNWSIFTENEKQQIYLQYHDELPYDLEITCELEEEKKGEIRLIRPNNTEPCNKHFYIKEEEIFCNPMSYNPIMYFDKYYQLCPHCGYIVRIPNEILSYEIKKRIEERNKQDRNLFRKMYLYSELFSLDKQSTKGQKKLLKK